MRMARKYAIIFLLALLSSCAQVGSISGGERDTAAPKPLSDQMEPQNASTNYQGNTFVIPFDEYFQLNNPIQTIRMVPPHATINAEMKKKTLYLSWEDTLETNTTYAIYLNGTVKDLNEGNDTTLQLVFSTGNVLDTASYTVAVVDAFSGEPQSDITVALFDPKTDRLKSLAKSENGVANLNYLSPGEYKMIAFEDENLDLEIQPEERIGFPEGAMVKIDSSFFDSIPIRTYQPFPKQRYKVKSFIAPGVFELESNAPIRYYGLKNAKINGKVAEFYTNPTEEVYYLVSPDTLGSKPAEIEITHITDTTDIVDTLTYRFRNKEQEKPIRLRATHATNVAPGENLSYNLYCQPNNILDDRITLRNSGDSSLITDYKLVLGLHEVHISLGPSVSGEVNVTIEEGAVESPFGSTEAFTENVLVKEEGDYGILNVDLSNYAGPIILEMLEKGKLVKRMKISDPSELLKLEQLPPGTYTFRIIRDGNGNGLWDLGNLESLVQPERVDSYSKATKVRANWEVEITLNPKENE
ncbi:MAG: Ig-like domain-containing protein [Crocinitomicaceae bacterium]